mmetsp:Transcript_3329/g.4967  ORF Transcript_3329/g.4967 Transcript_3329/m.4967 type:complete len:268 (-) Transcript_3329:119-922(-)
MTRIFRIALSIFLVLVLTKETHGAHSRRRPVTRLNQGQPMYDREITTFSEDGRLKQVEYGMEAADRGDTVVSVLVNETFAIVATSPDKIHRLDAHIILVTSGLKGDGRFLANYLRKYCQQHRKIFGEAPTVREVADYASKVHHQLTKYPGCRPFGCSTTVLGVNEGLLKLYLCEPGGGLEECNFCVGGRQKVTILDKLKGLLNSFNGSKNGLCVQNVTAATLELLQNEERKENDKQIDLWVIRAGEEALQLKCLKSVDKDSIQNLVL